MSRIGKNPIPLPDGVTVDLSGAELRVKGTRGELTTPALDGISFAIEDGALVAQRADETKRTRAFHGLARALAANAVTGVVDGFKRQLDIHGIGYRAEMVGSVLRLQLGFSHAVDFPSPADVTITTPDATHIVLEGNDKQRVGETAAQIRRFRPPDAYKGKGIRYSDEVVRTKVGKSGVGSK